MSVKQLPPAVPQHYSPLYIDCPGWWLLLSDLQIPFQQNQAIIAAIKEGQKQKPKGIILNGDILDCHELSDYDRDPDMPRYKEERKLGIQFLDYVRDKFPRATIIYKDGNHEERLQRYMIKRAPALYGLQLVNTKTILELEKFGIQHVGDKRVIKLGKLNVLHGHEYTERQLAAPVNPARGLYLRTKANAISGHWHQSSEHNEASIDTPKACWSTGCLCQLTPAYRPLNKWNLGFALVKVDNDGTFLVRNLRILDGKVI